MTDFEELEKVVQVAFTVLALCFGLGNFGLFSFFNFFGSFSDIISLGCFIKNGDFLILLFGDNPRL